MTTLVEFQKKEGRWISIDHKTFKKSDLKKIANCLYEESKKHKERLLSFLISFGDNSFKMDDHPDIFDTIDKNIKLAWMTLSIKDVGEVQVQLNESISPDRSDSFFNISGKDPKWIFAIEGEIRDILNSLDNKTKRIYNLGGWGILVLLFNLLVIVPISYCFLLIINRYFEMPQMFLIVLFVVFVQLSLYIVPFLTTTKFISKLQELQPRVEIVVNKTKMENYKNSLIYSALKNLFLPFVISMVVAWIAAKYFS